MSSVRDACHSGKSHRQFVADKLGSAVTVRLARRRRLHAARSDQSRLSARRAATSGVGAVAAEAAGMGKTTVLLFLGFVAAGCHAGPCGGCAEWETCDVTTDQCTLNAGTRF